MMKSVMILMLLCSLVIISGCGPKANIEENVYVGIEGAEMSFLPNVPLPKTFASTGDILDVAIEVKNLGTRPLVGRIFLSGFDPNVIQLPRYIDVPSRNCGFSQIFPKSKGYIEGGTCVEELHANLNLDSIIDSYDATIYAQIIYPYTTDANINLCIDPAVQRFSIGRKACQMTSVSVSGGQGAPVAVTSVEPSPIGGGKILYRITVANVGDGEVVNFNKAPTELKPNDVGQVAYHIGSPSQVGGGNRIQISSGGTGISIGRGYDIYFDNGAFGFNFRPNANFLYKSGNVRLYQGRGVITTVIDYGDLNTAFKTPLQIHLSYGYLEDARKDIKIVDVDNFESFERRGSINIIYDNNGRRIELDDTGRILYRDSDFAISIDDITALFGD